MTAARDVDRVVVVHGRTDERTEEALLAVGLEVAAEVGDTTVWVRRCPTYVAAAGTAPGASPASAGSTADVPSRLLLSVAEAAAVLGVGRTTAYGLIAGGQLEVVHIGRVARVPITAVQDLVDRLRRPVSPSQGRGTLAALGPADASQPRAAVDSQPSPAVRSAAS